MVAVSLLSAVVLCLYDAKVNGLLNLSVSQQKARFEEERRLTALKEVDAVNGQIMVTEVKTTVDTVHHEDDPPRFTF